MTDITEFIVESIDASDDAWKFFSETQRLDNKKGRSLSSIGGIPKRLTSLATNATIFRWKFGDGSSIDTNENPHIHLFPTSGTYSISHQSCYPCPSTGTLICSNGWCTKSIGLGAIPATIISNIYDCLYPCLAHITVTWQNLDTVAYTFRPAIIIDNTNTIPYTEDVTIPPGSIAIVVIYIPGILLPVGNRQVCATPY
jgi:hypothetical protein